MFCPHCETGITSVDIRSKKCPSCGKTVVTFQIDKVVKKYIHLFEVIAIFSAIALLLPQLTLGLKDLGIVIFSKEQIEIQIISLYFALVLCCILIIFFWLGIMTKVSYCRSISPVRRFVRSEKRNWFTIRRGDDQYYFFIVCFIGLYVFITMYILSTLSFGFIIFAGLFASVGIISIIHNYLSHDKEEREQEVF